MKRDGSEVVLCDVRGQLQWLSHLEAGARALGGRTLQTSAALARSGAAGRQSLWQLGSLPGSSPLGS